MTYAFSPSVDSLAEFKVRNQHLFRRIRRRARRPGQHDHQARRQPACTARSGSSTATTRSRRSTTPSPARASTSPRLNRNQFGANIGGPVCIPKLYNGTDKTFFFFNWESGYAAQGASSASASSRRTRSATATSADSSMPAPASRIVLNDPLERRHRRQRHPKAALSKEALAFLELRAAAEYPATASSTFVHTAASASFDAGQLTTPASITTFGTKDHRLRPLCVQRHLRSRHPVLGPRRAQQPRPHAERRHLYTHTFSPTLINELRARLAQVQRSRSLRHHQRSGLRRRRQDGTCRASPACRRSTARPPSASTDRTAASTRTICSARSARASARTPSLQFADTLSWQRGQALPEVRRRHRAPRRHL